MRVLSIAIALALAACSPPAEQPNAEASSSLSEVAPDDGKPPAEATALVTSEVLVGRWGDNGDCAKDIVFAADGTFRSYTGGTGTWSLDGNRIAMSGPGQTIIVQIQSLNDHQLIVGNPDGSYGISQRC